MSENANLTPIFTYSVPANHLLQLSLVKQTIGEQTYKKQYFFFITLIQGIKNADGSRGYDFKQNRITLKTDIHQIFAFAHALKSAASDPNYGTTGFFKIYVDSSKSAYSAPGATGKSLMVGRSTNQPKNQSQKAEPVVVLYFKLGQNQAVGFGVPTDIAIGISEVFHKMAEYALDLEIKKSQGAGFGTTPNPNLGKPPSAPPIGNPPTFNTSENVVDNFANAFETNFNDDMPPF